MTDSRSQTHAAGDERAASTTGPSSASVSTSSLSDASRESFGDHAGHGDDGGRSGQPELTLIAPALDEEDNVDELVRQIQASIIDAGIDAECIVVDDGSTDRTLEKLIALAADHPWLRPMHRPKPQGQSAAMHAAIQAARGKYVAMLDADLQNDPADLPAMLQLLRDGKADFVQGDRSQNRRDTFIRRMSSWVGRTARGLILKDPIRDTGCSTRVVRTDIARQFPLQFKGMHRFMPAYARMIGARIVEQPVNHRPRVAGVAKYGMFNRAFVGLVDCFAMRWMAKRFRDPAAEFPAVSVVAGTAATAAGTTEGDDDANQRIAAKGNSE